MATDEYGSYQGGLSSPASEAFAITPHNTNELAKTTRGIYVGTGGDLSVVLRNGGAAVTFSDVPSGVILPVRATKVMATGTTASGLVGLV